MTTVQRGCSKQLVKSKERASYIDCIVRARGGSHWRVVDACIKHEAGCTCRRWANCYWRCCCGLAHTKHSAKPVSCISKLCYDASTVVLPVLSACSRFTPADRVWQKQLHCGICSMSVAAACSFCKACYRICHSVDSLTAVQAEAVCDWTLDLHCWIAARLLFSVGGPSVQLALWCHPLSHSRG